MVAAAPPPPRRRQSRLSRVCRTTKARALVAHRFPKKASVCVHSFKDSSLFFRRGGLGGKTLEKGEFFFACVKKKEHTKKLFFTNNKQRGFSFLFTKKG